MSSPSVKLEIKNALTEMESLSDSLCRVFDTVENIDYSKITYDRYRSTLHRIHAIIRPIIAHILIRGSAEHPLLRQQQRTANKRHHSPEDKSRPQEQGDNNDQRIHSPPPAKKSRKEQEQDQVPREQEEDEDRMEEQEQEQEQEEDDQEQEQPTVTKEKQTADTQEQEEEDREREEEDQEQEQPIATKEKQKAAMQEQEEEQREQEQRPMTSKEKRKVAMQVLTDNRLSQILLFAKKEPLPLIESIPLVFQRSTAGQNLTKIEDAAFGRILQGYQFQDTHEMVQKVCIDSLFIVIHLSHPIFSPQVNEKIRAFVSALEQQDQEQERQQQQNQAQKLDCWAQSLALSPLQLDDRLIRRAQSLMYDASGQEWLSQLYTTMEAILWHRDFQLKSSGSGGRTWKQQIFFAGLFKCSEFYRSHWDQDESRKTIEALPEYKKAYGLFKAKWDQIRRSYSRLASMYDELGAIIIFDPIWTVTTCTAHRSATFGSVLGELTKILKEQDMHNPQTERHRLSKSHQQMKQIIPFVAARVGGPTVVQYVNNFFQHCPTQLDDTNIPAPAPAAEH